MRVAIKREKKSFFPQSAWKAGGFLLLVFLLSTAFSRAAINPKFNYQGKLFSAGGLAVSDGDYNIRLRLCSDSNCAGVVWTETLCYSPDNGATCTGAGTDQRVEVLGGLFSVLAGSVSSLSAVDFDQTLYLEVQVGGSGATPTWETLLPRKEIGSVPTAFNAKNVLSDGRIDIDNLATTSDALNINYNPASGSYDAAEIIYGAGGGTGTALKVAQNGNGIGAMITNLGSGLSFRVNDETGEADTTPFVIDAAGNVGIGTTSPGKLLSLSKTVVASSYQGLLRLEDVGTQADTSTGIDWRNTEYSWDQGRIAVIRSGSSSSFHMAFSTATSGVLNEAVRITNSGNIGIGTTGPTTALDITKSSTSAVTLTIRNTNGATGAWTGLRQGNDLAINRLEIWTIPSTYVDSGLYHADGSLITNEGVGGLTIGATHTSGILRFASGGANERMTIIANGNVGIGTTGPNTTLEVRNSGSPTEGAVKVDIAGTAAYSSGIDFYTTGASRGFVGWRGTSSTAPFNVSGMYLINKDNSNLILGTNNLERLRIDTNGNVGIGTTGPAAPLNTYKAPTTGFVEQIRVGGTSNYRSLDFGTWGAYDAYMSTYGNDLHILAGRGVSTENHNIKFYTGSIANGVAESNQRMIIQYTGNVGIGTTDPGSYKLYVNGNTYINGTLSGISTLTATTFSGALSGNATTATTLQTARTIDGTSFNGSANIQTTEWYHSGRDFPSGTIITTSINYAVSSGDPFILEIKGNSYGNQIPLDIQYQGYIYSDTIINHGGYSNGVNITGLVALNVGGYLTFWFPSQGYWQGYNVRVYTAYGTYALNKVTSITGGAKPSGTKEVALSANIRQSLHSSNYNSYAPTLTGTGASGTWGINISGNSATASSASSLPVGSLLYSRSGQAVSYGGDGGPQVYGQGGGAAMLSLHRPGAYAVNFGLDTDNQLKVGGWSMGAASYKVWHAANDGSGSGLDADTLDGFNSSAFGDATAANQSTILSRIGTSSDAASMASTLFAGQQAIYDNMRAYYYITSDTYNGSTADTACASGYHMCTQTEYIGRTYNTTLGGDSISEDIAWVDNNSNLGDGVGFADCYNWSGTSSSWTGNKIRITSGYQTTDYCYNYNRVLCCN